MFRAHRFCSRRGLAQIVEAIIPPDERVGHNVEAIMAHFADGGDGDGHGEEERALDYDRVVGDMSQFPELSSMFPAYLSSSVDHFRTPRQVEPRVNSQRCVPRHHCLRTT